MLGGRRCSEPVASTAWQYHYPAHHRSSTTLGRRQLGWTKRLDKGETSNFFLWRKYRLWFKGHVCIIYIVYWPRRKSFVASGAFWSISVQNNPVRNFINHEFKQSLTQPGIQTPHKIPIFLNKNAKDIIVAVFGLWGHFCHSSGNLRYNLKISLARILQSKNKCGIKNNYPF